MHKADVRMFQDIAVQNVLSVKFSSIITLISAMKWSCCLDT